MSNLVSVEQRLEKLAKDVEVLMRWRYMILGGFSVISVIGVVCAHELTSAIDAVENMHDAQIRQGFQIETLEQRLDAVLPPVDKDALSKQEVASFRPQR